MKTADHKAQALPVVCPNCGTNPAPYCHAVGTVHVHIGPDRGISWSDGWEKLDSLAKEGLLVRRFYGAETYGHVGYFLPEFLIPSDDTTGRY